MKQTITDLEGVYANAIAAGIKEDGLDLAYIHVPNAVSCAGVFTQHKFSASSVTYTKRCIKHNTLKAIVINSGNANAFTGEKGHSSVKHIMKALSDKIGTSIDSVLMASTGVIGENLPYKKVIDAIKL